MQQLRGQPATGPLRTRRQPSCATLTRDGLRTYLRYWCDAFRLPDWPADRVVSRVRVEGEDHLRASTGEGGRGLVAALMHMGNWDAAGAWLSTTGAPVVTVAERLRPEPLYDRFVAYREGLGMEVLPLTGGDGDLLEPAGPAAGRRLVPPARRPGPAHGHRRDLLGEPPGCRPGRRCSPRTGAALLPVGHVVHLPGPAGRAAADPLPRPGRAARGAAPRDRVTAGTQALADRFATEIAARPQDWHMLQRLWVADLDPAPRPSRAG